MQFLLAALSAASFCAAAPLQSALPVIQSLSAANAGNTSISMVSNSGICETTPGVQTYSGYVHEENNQNFFYWFFEARHDAENAPFTIWFNGGPGCSSQVGLWQEHGPCKVNSDNKTTTLNEYSWNNYSNIIYVDQPIGTGFSYGNDTVTSTFTSAPPVWKLFQILFANNYFSKYKSRELALFTESYGGHYGPQFATYFDMQNGYIAAGQLDAIPLKISVLGINNGWYDPLIQNEQYSNFSYNNPDYQVINKTIYDQMQYDLYKPGGCNEQTKACYENATDIVCSTADAFCGDTQFSTGIQDRDSYDILDSADVDFPPEGYTNYLNLPEVQAAIGAKVNYTECADAPYEGFAITGDDSRTLLPQLQEILNEGQIRTLIWAGELDFNCNWYGSEACLLDPGWSGSSAFAAKPYQDLYYANGNGTKIGSGKSEGNLTFIRVLGAGHEVPAYRPAAAYQIFVSMMKGQKFFGKED